MPRRRMNPDQYPQSEPSGLAKAARCIKSACLGCGGCVSNTFSRILDCISDTWDDWIDCLAEKCCAYKEATRDDTKESEASATRKDLATKTTDTIPRIRVNQSSVNANSQVVNSSNLSQKIANPLVVAGSDLPKVPIKDTKTKVVPTMNPTTAEACHSYEANSSVAKQVVTPQTTIKQQVDAQSEIRPKNVLEPPKIDFVETGSIFGDRKRSFHDLNALQIENGRFRSPGLSKTVQGPGGRTIRVSFVTGFPLVKSIDSTKSPTMQNNISSKRSIESLAQTTGSRETIGKNLKSTRSFKSTLSLQEQRGPDY